MLETDVRDAAEILSNAAEIALSRYHKMKSFIGTSAFSDDDFILLDATAMQLQVVGEKVKKIEQLSPGLLQQYGVIAKPIIRMRDFLSHHYENVDYNAIVETCRDHLPDLLQKINILLADH